MKVSSNWLEMLVNMSVLEAGSDPAAVCCSPALTWTGAGVCSGAAVGQLCGRCWGGSGVPDIGRLWGDGGWTPFLIHAAEERRWRGLGVSLVETDK